jgi:uncharacterized protein YceK
MKKFQLCFLMLCGLLSGCASIHQTFISKSDESMNVSNGYENKVYAGTKKDGKLIHSCFVTIITPWAIFTCPVALVATIDLPFSIVGDTLFLPYTIPSSTTSEKLYKAKLQETEREQGLVVDFIRHNDEILRASGGIKQLYARPHLTTENRVIPNRYEAGVIGNDERTIYAIVRVSNVPNENRFTLECITRLSWGNRQTRKDVCEQ